MKPSSDPTANIIEPVQALGAYTLKATEARVKLNQNESPFDLDAGIKARILATVGEQPWNRYPDFYPEDVLSGIGALHGLEASNVLAGNGSNELIQAIFAAVVEPGVQVAIPSPTFSLYRMMIACNGGEVIDVPLTESFSYDLSRWQALADQGDAHLLICSPNNPTGSSVDKAFIRDLAGRTDRLVIVDEAYQQFGDEDLASLVRELPNVVALRTFSKALGLAGVRFGYALADERLVTEISKVKLPYNVNRFTLEVVREFLRDPSLLDTLAAKLRAERHRIEAACADVGFADVVRGMANFVVVRTDRARSLFDFLYERGILIRDIGGYPMLSDSLRISVGTPEENDELVGALRDFFQKG